MRRGVQGGGCTTWVGFCTSGVLQVGMGFDQCLQGVSSFQYQITSYNNNEYIGGDHNLLFSLPTLHDPVKGHSIFKKVGKWYRASKQRKKQEKGGDYVV